MEPRVTVAGEPEKEKRSPTKRMPILVGITALVVLAVAVGIWQFYVRRPTVEPASVERMAYPLPDKASIAILPFVNMTGDPEQDYIVDGISDNIISTFSKIPNLFIISRNSTFTYKGKPVQIKQVSEELGVRYVLEGSVQISNDRLRVSAQLIDALKGNHLWAETFDRDFTDLFNVMDEISLAIAKALSVELLPYPLEGGTRKADTKILKAWTLYVKGYHHIYRLSKEDNAKAIDLLERAIELDPNFAAAWTALATAHKHAARYGYSPSRTESIKRATELALKSLEMDDSLSETHWELGDIYLVQRKYDQALPEYEKAVAFNPNDSFAYWRLGRALFFIGQPDKAIPLIKKSMRLNPHYGWGFPTVLGKIYYHSGRYEDAMAMFQKVLEICEEGRGSLKWPHLYLSMVYVELGQYKEARSHMKKVLEYDPHFSIQGRRKQNLYKDQAMNERELDAHRKAGAPEHPPSQ
jgi:TolB-like protein/Tfp pilus assembly protein PilF